MDHRRIKAQKGQASLLETLVVFIVIVLLFGGIFNIWVWGNKQIVERQRSYNAGRVAAGTSSVDYDLVKTAPAEELREEKVILSP